MSNAKSRAEKEREKQVQEKVQLILGAMLKEDDNRYCVDCDSKGPRWASWNLGVFLCIRCAGIHRNLGVHISKVKSVNLDSWTPQQVASMQMMGNSKGRAIYEANLPSDYRRPQNDQAVEAFIRQKYEKKKYIAAEWVPSKPPDFPVGWDSVTAASVENKKPEFKKLNLPASKAGAEPVKASVTASQSSKAQPQPQPQLSKPVTQQPQLVKSVAPVLSSSVVKSASSSLDTDLLGLSISSPSSAASSTSSTIPSSASAQDLLGLNSEFSGFVSASVPAAAPSDSKPDLTDNSLNSAVSDGGKMSKDSIMALFGSKSSTASPSPLVNNMPQQPQQQQFGSFQQFGQQQMQFGQPQAQQQQQQQQQMFGQFQSPSMFPQQQQLPQQQQQNFLSGSGVQPAAAFGQPQPAVNLAAGQPAHLQNNDMFDFFNSKPSQINNNQTPANNPFLGLGQTNQLNGLNLGNTGPSLFQ